MRKGSILEIDCKTVREGDIIIGLEERLAVVCSKESDHFYYSFNNEIGMSSQGAMYTDLENSLRPILMYRHGVGIVAANRCLFSESETLRDQYISSAVARPALTVSPHRLENIKFH